ncbi:MAG: acylphosphatase [Nitrospirae bacterium]|nr:acylphosphatase [Nitrospirota bacterium]
MILIAAEILVSGRVQGVYYRAFTQEAALRLGLTGFCRNLPDGRVEVVAEGDREVIETLIDQLRIGPPRARVEDIQVNWKPAEKSFKDFSIRYRS